ncbi:MAG: NAD-dependent deacylase [Leptospiraceae bacterium]|nr:NAD-dependent deacylase [Leptospiraceae bacterium]
MSDNEVLTPAIRALLKSKNPMILTGAGISAESGIPTFRGKDGYWRNHDPLTLATPEAFAKDSRTVWEWYNYRKEIITSKQPNAGHFAIVKLKELLPDLTVITQNVDGLHQRAGLIELYEMHGNIFKMKCLSCNTISINSETTLESLFCPECGSNRVRPNVVWFGESIPGEIINSILDTVRNADLIMTIGTSGTVYPAAGFAIEVRRREGVVIDINPDANSAFSNDILIREPAGLALPRLVEQFSALR